VNADLLIKNGFVKGPDGKKLFNNGVLNEALFEKYYTFGEKRSVKLKEGVDLKEAKKELKADEEKIEIIADDHKTTGYPSPLKSYWIVWEAADMSLEAPYFWLINTIKEFFPMYEKLEDSFAASENSAFFGISQQRLGGQQDKVAQFLATSGKMIKELFQMVRELRIIDERLTYYNEMKLESEKELEKRGKSASVVLKGLFVDLVQGGGKSAASVYGMARELEFITLPDLFFDAPPFKDVAEMEKYVDGLAKDFNDSVRRVLIRHLRSFHEWSIRTHKEHEDRRRFMLKYLEQHFQIIQMYLEWIKPYLKHVAKLTMKEENMKSIELISAFEGSMIEIEVLARNNKKIGESGANGCLLASFMYRTRPDMKFVQEGYNRGPSHHGHFEVRFRIYGWSDEQVESYRRMKEMEGLELLGNVSSSVAEAMNSLGGELTKYLDEARGKKEEKKKEEEKKKSLVETFFGEFYTPSAKKPKVEKKSSKEVEANNYQMEQEIKKRGESTKWTVWFTYKNFKKAHGMVQW
jgi:hypothetical protein